MTDRDVPEVRAWRLKKGITLEAIAAETRLSMRYLEAIESGQFKKLPGAYADNTIEKLGQSVKLD